jgi:hypothetical protein
LKSAKGENGQDTFHGWLGLLNGLSLNWFG